MPDASYITVPRSYLGAVAVGFAVAPFDIIDMCDIAEVGAIGHVVRVSVTGWTTGPRTASMIEPSSSYF